VKKYPAPATALHAPGKDGGKEKGNPILSFRGRKTRGGLEKGALLSQQKKERGGRGGGCCFKIERKKERYKCCRKEKRSKKEPRQVKGETRPSCALRVRKEREGKETP